MTLPSPRIRRAPESKSKTGSAVLRWAGPAPALLTILGVLLFVFTVLFQQSSRTDAHYREEANNSISSGDYQTSRLCYERLLQSHRDDPALLYGLARSLDGLHQTAESYAVLLSIAPPDAAGYAPAHLMLAEELLGSKHKPETLALAEKHLRRVLDADPQNEEAISLLAGIKAHGNSPEPGPKSGP